jgi:hypothetical protein
MGFLKRAPAGRGPEELRGAFLDACASVADTKAKCKKATETATDSGLYRLMKQLSTDLDPIYLYIDGILDEYLELRNGGRRPARVQ